jgi:general secretion pathway protein B
LPRWALAVIGVLVAAVLVIGGAWWRSTRVPAEVASSQLDSSPAATVERTVALPAPAPRNTASQQSAPARLPLQDESPLSTAAASSTGSTSGSDTDDDASLELSPLPRPTNLPDDSVALPNVAMLAAEGVAVPPLRLELHAFSAQPRARFVFINGRKYVEGDRLVEGPLLVAIQPTGAVLTHAGRRFMLVQE